MKKISLITLLYLLIMSQLIFAIPRDEKLWVRVGSLQTFFQAWGGERAFDANAATYVGLQWPAWYDNTDNHVIDRLFLACKDFTGQDTVIKSFKATKVQMNSGEDQFVPIEISQIGKYAIPAINVDGVLQENDEVLNGGVNNELVTDRKIVNVVNTNLGIEMTRNIYAYSRKDHDNYFITEYNFKNTGNIDEDDVIELSGDIHDFYFGVISRYCTSQEAKQVYHMRQAQWGAHQWVHHTPMVNSPELPYMYTWIGQAQTPDINIPYDNIGVPTLSEDGYFERARLRAVQFAGTAILHVDEAYDQTRNDNSKIKLGWYIGDEVPAEGSDQQIWDLLHDNYNALGMYDTSMDDYAEHMLCDKKSPYSVTGGENAGTNTYMSFGPFEIPFGESIQIVVVEGVSGLNREKSIEIGENWYKAYSGESVEFDLPSAPLYRSAESIDADANPMDIYKDMWVYTGKDSIIKTFYQAKEAYENDYNIALPPAPPSSFSVFSHEDSIVLEWADNSTTDPNFEGYRIYRSAFKPDTIFQKVFECNVGQDDLTQTYVDQNCIPGVDYYYYVVSYSEDSEAGLLESGRAYTQTKIPAKLTANVSTRIVPEKFALVQNYPNPFNPSTTIRYELPEAACVSLIVYDMNGHEIRELVSDDMPAGSHSVVWNGRDQFGSILPSGMYFYRIIAGEFIQTKKMVLLK